jgi:hypothetical protein
MNGMNYSKIASLKMAIENCIHSGNKEWEEKHRDSIQSIMDSAPRGSGVDNGVHFLESDSTPDKLVFSCDFHHMDEVGGYDGWTEHKVTVRPSLAFGYKLTISGQNRNDIKEYLGQLFDSWLTESLS